MGLRELAYQIKNEYARFSEYRCAVLAGDEELSGYVADNRDSDGIGGGEV